MHQRPPRTICAHQFQKDSLIFAPGTGHHVPLQFSETAKSEAQLSVSSRRNDKMKPSVSPSATTLTKHQSQQAGCSNSYTGVDHTLAIINHRQSDGTQRSNRYHRQTTWPRGLKALSPRPAAAAAAAREVSTFRSSSLLKLH